VATAHLDAINRLPWPKPWRISFSYGRALQAWHDRGENLEAGRQALYQRARCNSAASLGRYTEEMEATTISAGSPPHRGEWRDD
jgi:fructose-bisphosphate aldolase class I